MIVAKRISFDAAHYLPKHEGKCKRMHGHHWVVELAVEGPVGKCGMVTDFSLLIGFLDWIIQDFDHKLLNDTIPNPTAENICLHITQKFPKYFGDSLKKDGVELKWIKVWETLDSVAELRSD